jgi:hypothetical protein
MCENNGEERHGSVQNGSHGRVNRDFTPGNQDERDGDAGSPQQQKRELGCPIMRPGLPLQEDSSACEQHPKQQAKGDQCEGSNFVKCQLDPQKRSGPDAAENDESCPVFGLHIGS